MEASPDQCGAAISDFDEEFIVFNNLKREGLDCLSSGHTSFTGKKEGNKNQGMYLNFD